MTRFVKNCLSSTDRTLACLVYSTPLPPSLLRIHSCPYKSVYEYSHPRTKEFSIPRQILHYETFFFEFFFLFTLVEKKKLWLRLLINRQSQIAVQSTVMNTRQEVATDHDQQPRIVSIVFHSLSFHPEFFFFATTVTVNSFFFLLGIRVILH